MRIVLSNLLHYVKAIVLDDWKGRLVLGGVIIAGATTLLTYFFIPDATNVQTFFGAAFASWLSGFFLFIITGLIIAVVTLVRPDQELFEARARNLLQRQTGPHVDYIIGKLHDLFEPYCESNTRVLNVVDYDPATKMFLVIQETEITFRSYLVDIPVTFQSRIGYVNGSPSPDNRRKCCLSHLKVDGKSVGDTEEFETQVIRSFEMQVLPNSLCKVEHRITFWVKEADEANRQLVKRFTRNMGVTIHNHLPTQKILVEQPSATDLNRDISPGERAQVVNLKEMRPSKNEDEYAFDFRLKIA